MRGPGCLAVCVSVTNFVHKLKLSFFKFFLKLTPISFVFGLVIYDTLNLKSRIINIYMQLRIFLTINSFFLFVI